MRIGLGYDIHRLEPGDGFMLAGVRVACPFRVIAHSDGDVVLHALCDALLVQLQPVIWVNISPTPMPSIRAEIRLNSCVPCWHYRNLLVGK